MPQFDDPRAAPSDALLADLVAADGPGCSAAVGLGGTVVWAGAVGIADLTTRRPLDTTTRFEFASVSKQFTAQAVLLLAREGALDLAAPVARYVDGLPTWGETLTLDDLIHHASRLPDPWPQVADAGLSFADEIDQEQALDLIRAIPAVEPGTGYLYSNSNYVLLAAVVERVAGQSLPEFLAERYFAPLGLQMEIDPGSTDPDLARGYADDLTPDVPRWRAYGHVGLVTTPSELARWGDEYREGGAVDPAFADGALDEGTGRFYAAGIESDGEGGLGHAGAWGGSVSLFTVGADRETTIVAACNRADGPRFELVEALWGIWGSAP